MITNVAVALWARSAPAAGLLFDEVFGEPPNAIHPVALLGRGLGGLEQVTYRDSRAQGIAHLVISTVPAFVGAKVLDRVIGPRAAIVVSVGVATAGSMLRGVATTVAERLEAGDLDAARSEVRSLVGRDPSALDEAEIVRAVVESVAENTVDAVTASLFWSAIGGSAGVLVHRTVNTLDAMVGHRSDRYQNFGWASARADDVMNWLPARLTAAAVVVAVPSNARAVIKTVRNDGQKHPSPNGGVVEAAFAGALDVTLGGSNDYGGMIEVRGPLGDGPPPVTADIARAVSISRRAGWITSAGVILIGIGARRAQSMVTRLGCAPES